MIGFVAGVFAGVVCLVLLMRYAAECPCQSCVDERKSGPHPD